MKTELESKSKLMFENKKEMNFLNLSRRAFFIGALTLFALTATAFAVGNVYFSTNALSSFAYLKDNQGQNIYQTQNHKYFVQELFKGGAKQKYLFSSKELSQTFEDLDHVENGIEISAFTDSGTQSFGKKIWTLKEPATSAGAAFNANDLIVLTYNKDASDVSYRAYDVATGALLISYQDTAEQKVNYPAPYLINIPNSSVPTRYAGLITAFAAHDFDEPATPPPAGFQNTVLLKYGALDKFINKWMIQTQAQADFTASVTKVEIVPFGNAPNSNIELMSNLINLWDLDGSTSASAVGGFAFRISLALGDIEIVVAIPVRNDKLDLDQALIPARVKIVVLK